MRRKREVVKSRRQQSAMENPMAPNISNKSTGFNPAILKDEI
jgi:hypothetical protein